MGHSSHLSTYLLLLNRTRLFKSAAIKIAIFWWSAEFLATMKDLLYVCPLKLTDFLLICAVVMLFGGNLLFLFFGSYFRECLYFLQLQKSPVTVLLFGNPANIYLFIVSNRSIRKKCEICSKLTIKDIRTCHWRHSGVFIVNVEHISQPFLVFLLLTLNE